MNKAKMRSKDYAGRLIRYPTVTYELAQEIVDEIARDFYNEAVNDCAKCIIVDGNPEVARERILKLRKVKQYLQQKGI